MHRAGAPRRRRGRLRGRGDARPGARRGRADHGRLRQPAGGDRDRDRERARPAPGPRRRPEQPRLRLGVRRARGGRGRARQGGARGRAADRQQPPDLEPDRAARRARRVRGRQVHAPDLLAGRVAPARPDRRRDPPDRAPEPPGADAGRRRRLRHQGVPLPGVRHARVRRPAGRAPGQVDRRAQRDLRLGRHGPRPRDHRAPRARRRSPDPRPRGRHRRQPRRLHQHVRPVHPDRGGAQGPARRVRRQAPGLPGQGRAHQHHARRCLSRRRAAGIDLPDGAPDGRGGARGRPRPGRVPAPQPGRGRRHAVPLGGRRDLRFGRVRAG